MSVQEAAQRIAADASEALGPESGLFARADKADFGKSVLSVLGRAAMHPADVGAASLRFGAALARSWPAAITRWLGSGAEPPMPVDAGDKRFTDAAWRDNPAYFGAAAGISSCPEAGRRPAGCRAGQPGRRPEGKVCPRPRLRRSCPDQLPAHQPGRAEEGVRDRRRQRPRRGPQLPRRCCNNHGRPRQVNSAAFELGRNLAATPGQGGVPQRPDGADPVHTTEHAGAVGPATGQPAVDQQVLHHGSRARAELHRMGRTASAHSVRDLLPQPRPEHERRHPRRLPHPRPEDRARCDFRDHRLAHDRHRGAVPRRHPDRDARRLPRRDG